MPGVAGTWLPLCSSTPVGCELGHYPKKGLPSVTCTAKGVYSYTGSCRAISCGKPDPLPHAIPRISDLVPQNWTMGVVIHYDCEKPGYRGRLKAVCNISGHWIWHGECEQVFCGPPPQDIPHAKVVVHPNWTNDSVSTGTVVRYQCDTMYNGTPTATCGDDGMYVTVGRCRRECGSPPALPHASPNFDNALVAAGWMEGMRATYICDPNYLGHVTAMCCTDGNYSSSGECSINPSSETKHLHKQVQTLNTVVCVENALFGLLILFWCWNVRCYMGGRSIARNPHQEMGSPPAFHRNQEFMLPERYASSDGV